LTATTYHGDTLWRTDGTDAGTFAILGGAPHTGELRIANHWSAGDKFYFQTVDQSSEFYDLLVSDGTIAGTHRLDSDADEGPGFSQLGDLVAFGTGAAFFNYGSDQNSVFVTDGTSRGTRTLFELNSEENIQSIFAASDGRLFVVSYHNVLASGVNVYNLWVVEPSDSVPRPVTSTTGNSTLAGIDSIREAAGRIIFRATTDRGANELWSVNTNLVAMSLLPGSSPGAQWSNLEIVLVSGDGSVLLLGGTNSFTKDLWHYDAEMRRTSRLTYTNTNNFNVYRGSTTLGGACFFLFDGTLWTSDGTAAGTRPLIGSNLPNSSGAKPGFLNVAQVGERLMLLGDDAEHGREWWTSDGTANGTQLLLDILPGAESGTPRFFPGNISSAHDPD